jgi:hypothetical protein
MEAKVVRVIDGSLGSTRLWCVEAGPERDAPPAAGARAWRAQHRAALADLVRRCGATLGEPPWPRHCPRHGRNFDHGRPLVATGALQFSLSRWERRALVAVDERVVGVDLAPVTRAGGWRRLARHFCDPAELDDVAATGARGISSERELARRWAAKEAILKADGRGLVVDPRDVATRRGAPAGALRALAPFDRWQLVELDPGAGAVACLARAGEAVAPGAPPP